MSSLDSHAQSRWRQSVNGADMEEDSIPSHDGEQHDTSYILEPGYNEFGIENMTSKQQTVNNTSCKCVHSSSATDRQELSGESFRQLEDPEKVMSKTFLGLKSETVNLESEAAFKGPRSDQVPKENIHETEKVKVWIKQTEQTRLSLIAIAYNQATEEDLRAFAIQLAEIIKLWQDHAAKSNPTYYNIEFGQDLKLNLLQVFALIPEEYQRYILVDDRDRSPNRDGYDMSWLHDQTIEVLACLAYHPGQNSICFGRGLTSGVRITVDEMMLKAHSTTYLEYHIREMLENKPRSNWMADEIYSFSPSTTKIVYFFNYNEKHWTLLTTDISREKWTHTLYNSLEIDREGATWSAAHRVLPLIEALIQGASALTKPDRSEIVAGRSAQQKNSYDCGVIAVYNAVRLLSGRKPEEHIDTKQLRLEYLKQILSKLQSGVGSNTLGFSGLDLNGTDFKRIKGPEKKGQSAPLQLKERSKDNKSWNADDMIDLLSLLSSEDKAALQRLRGPLSSKTISEILEAVRSKFLVENIQIVPSDFWNELDIDKLEDGCKTENPESQKPSVSKLKEAFWTKIRSLFASYLTPPRNEVRPLNPQPYLDPIPEAPRLVLLPICRDGFWKMIAVTLTSTYCSCQIYEPGHDIGGRWDGLEDSLAQVCRAVFGVSGTKIRWNRFQRVDLSPEQAQVRGVDSGTWIIGYAAVWFIEYTKAVIHNGILSDPMFGEKTELDNTRTLISFTDVLVGKCLSISES